MNVSFNITIIIINIIKKHFEVLCKRTEHVHLMKLKGAKLLNLIFFYNWYIHSAKYKGPMGSLIADINVLYVETKTKVNQLTIVYCINSFLQSKCS